MPARKGRAVPAPIVAASELKQQLDITFDLYQLTVADLPLITKMKLGQAGAQEIVDLFDRVVIGGSKAIPFPALGQAARAFYEAVAGAQNPETPAGN